MPVYPCSIRQPMRADGNAGEELPSGEIGHVCFRGPQTFLGYVNDPEATAQTISRDGFLYTGDLGYKDAAGLHLTGRAKWVIKSFGYQIFPGDVEGISAVWRPKSPAVSWSASRTRWSPRPPWPWWRRGPGRTHPPGTGSPRAFLAVLMRPRHWIILEPGQMPLNRVVKPDYARAQEMARRRSRNCAPAASGTEAARPTKPRKTKTGRRS